MELVDFLVSRVAPQKQPNLNIQTYTRYNCILFSQPNLTCMRNNASIRKHLSESIILQRLFIPILRPIPLFYWYVEIKYNTKICRPCNRR